jgi:hypothetical protein
MKEKFQVELEWNFPVKSYGLHTPAMVSQPDPEFLSGPMEVYIEKLCYLRILGSSMQTGPPFMNLN